MFDPATFLHDTPEFVGGSVASHDIEGTARTRVLESGIQGSLTFVDNADLLSCNISVLQAHCQFFGFAAAAHYVTDVFGNFFDVAVPDPGKIFTFHTGIAGND